MSHCIVVNLETDYSLDESTVPRESNLIKKRKEKSSQQVQQNQPIRCKYNKIKPVPVPKREDSFITHGKSSRETELMIKTI